MDGKGKAFGACRWPLAGANPLRTGQPPGLHGRGHVIGQRGDVISSDTTQLCGSVSMLDTAHTGAALGNKEPVGNPGSVKPERWAASCRWADPGVRWAWRSAEA